MTTRHNFTFLRWLLAVLTLLLLLATPGSLLAQAGEVTDDDVNRVASQLFCPTCANRPVDTCPTQTCNDWRAIIRQQLGEGRSDEEIIQYFVDQFGEGVRVTPARSGWGMLVWILPALVTVGGVIWFVRFMSGLQKRDGTPPVTPLGEGTAVPPVDDYRARIEAELNQTAD